jgi:hypothetical protein
VILFTLFGAIFETIQLLKKPEQKYNKWQRFLMIAQGAHG